tara:strand:+ start:204 stop:389 length:186 start_codon:yes stop_codon:yes gene_type:complete
MFTITEEQRKELLAYMFRRPYGEVATLIGMLASLKPQTTGSTMETTKLVEEKKDGSKKDLS